MPNNELYHYGVLGMRWGVRRYQNEDGSYTQKGLERYRRASDNYEAASARKRRAKASGDAYELSDAKREVKGTKRTLDKAYKSLKNDRWADRGKELYQEGKTITDGKQRTAIAQGAIILGSRVAGNILASTYGQTRTTEIAVNTMFLGATAVNAAIAAKTAYNNRALRAYYGHSGNKRLDQEISSQENARKRTGNADGEPSSTRSGSSRTRTAEEYRYLGDPVAHITRHPSKADRAYFDAYNRVSDRINDHSNGILDKFNKKYDGYDMDTKMDAFQELLGKMVAEELDRY